jgi:hypothetical protein
MMHRLAASTTRQGTNFSSCQWRWLSSSSSSSSSSYTARSPTAETKTWERSASKVKDTDLSDNNPYLDAIRETHDPSQHLKTVEDELKGENNNKDRLSFCAASSNDPFVYMIERTHGYECVV